MATSLLTGFTLVPSTLSYRLHIIVEGWLALPGGWLALPGGFVIGLTGVGGANTAGAHNLLGSCGFTQLAHSIRHPLAATKAHTMLRFMKQKLPCDNDLGAATIGYFCWPSWPFKRPGPTRGWAQWQCMLLIPKCTSNVGPHVGLAHPRERPTCAKRVSGSPDIPRRAGRGHGLGRARP